MCGIAGMVGAKDPPTPLVLELMSRALAHRGPDEQGTWIRNGTALAVRRLRVVDLYTGQQPLTNEDGTLRLVANGEIYNADELRETLAGRGHQFTSRTDIEVILHAYEEDGPRCVERLEGMFAFALWDDRRRRLFLARDRFGEKPLYYARLPRAFVFASELKALLVHPGISRELDWAALARYLTHEYVPAPHAIFRTPRKLLPAHWMTVEEDGAVTIERYWTPPAPAAVGPSRRRAAEEVRALLDASIRHRIACDVPWGTFLSGGVDSSLVTALAVTASPKPVKTFAIGFEEPSYDERTEAADVARVLGTEHHEVVLSAEMARTMLPEASRVFDEPFADASALPALVLSRLARDHVTVVLSGDGGDELFCGYPTQTAHLAADLIRHTPASLGRLLTLATGGLPTSHRYLSFDFALRRFVRDAWQTPASRHLRWMGSFAPEALPHLLTPEVLQQIGEDPYAEAYARLAGLDGRSSSDVATALDLIFYLAEDNLVLSDRASMATALEVRAPFLDRRVAEFALRLPATVRRGLWRTKPVLRRAARPLLPARVSRRSKHGFGVPTGAWLRGALRPLAEDLLAPARLDRQGIFNSGYVTTLWQRHLSGAENYRKELWTLVMFQLWANAYWGV